jgi:hypothetical protein
MPKLERAEKVQSHHRENRHGTQELYGCEQTQSIVTINNDTTENTQYQAWRCLTERENAESHRGSSDLVD